MILFSKLKDEQGIALYLCLTMLTVLLGMALGLSVILVGQLKVVRGIGESDLAIYASESGIERVAYIDTKFCGSESSAQQRVLCINAKIAELPPSEFQLSNGSQYSLLVERTGQGSCPASAPDYCAKSTGTYKGARRAIRLTR
ncbi:MAG: hypothetical protein Q8R55_06115 [Candidatus Taylorbacteria bacterium]|nr:hypothetical protein [Candidatus Taylorbacteria bacterium]